METKNLVYYQYVRENVPNINTNFAILKLGVHIDSPELKEEYLKRIGIHNKMCSTAKFIDSGFDLLVSDEIKFTEKYTSKFIDMGVKAEMLYCNISDNTITNSAFTIHPRSSISKTNLMLANHTGIIDAGYRGPIIGAFRWLKPKIYDAYIVDKYTRLVQVCHPSLCPIYVIMVEEHELSTTERGDGGFGSTGK